MAINSIDEKSVGLSTSCNFCKLNEQNITGGITGGAHIVHYYLKIITCVSYYVPPIGSYIIIPLLNSLWILYHTFIISVSAKMIKKIVVALCRNTFVYTDHIQTNINKTDSGCVVRRP